MARPSKSSRVLKGVLPDIIPLMNKYEVMLHRRMKKLHTSAHLSDVGPESEMHHLHVEAMEYRMGVRISTYLLLLTLATFFLFNNTSKYFLTLLFDIYIYIFIRN